MIRKSVTFENMARHCGVHKTYLSKVLIQDGNLSADQFYLACEYLKVNAFEHRYLENLYLQNTTVVPKRAEIFRRALEKARLEILKSENSIKSESVDPVKEQQILEKYYFDPFYQLIHMFFTVKSYAQDPLKIVEVLGLKNEKFDCYLQDLIAWQIIEFKNNSYNVVRENLHLSKDSQLNTVFRNLSRQASMNKMNQSENSDFYSFSVMFSADKKTKEKLQKKFLEFLKQSQSDVLKSESQDVYQMNFDLLKWS